MTSRSEIERLRLFVERVQRLLDRRGIRAGTIASEFTMKGNATSTEFTFDIGDEDDLISTMAVFRQFTADKEDTHFPRICNLLEQVLNDPELREANRHNRRAWQRAEKGDTLLQVPGHSLDHRACYDLWINAEIFHADHRKEVLYRSLPDAMTGLIRTRASSFVIDGTRVLVPHRNLVQAHLHSIAR